VQAVDARGWRCAVDDFAFDTPCLACGAITVYRRDSAGELVRQPALQIVAEAGCSSIDRRYTWAPSHYLHLCRVLGLELPAGVLE
jgi:hypothetical protein